MGNCFSKKTPGPGSSENKIHKPRHKHSKNNGTWGTEELLNEEIPLNGDEEDSWRETFLTPEANSGEMSPSDLLVHDHFDDRLVESGVVPSDSGIESIGNVPEDAGGLISKQDRDELSKKLERLSLGSCHKCGNFRLDDFALSALLSGTYCLCGPRQAGKPTVNPLCQAHGSERGRKSTPTLCNTICDPSIKLRSEDSTFRFNPSQANGFQNGTDHTGLKSSMKKSYACSKDKNLRVSVHPADGSNVADIILPSEELGTYAVPDNFEEENSPTIAPLAEFDSLEGNLNDLSHDRNEKRRSLLSEILDITNSICRCDVNSEDDATVYHHNNGSAREITPDTFKTGKLNGQSSENCKHFKESKKDLINSYNSNKNDCINGLHMNTFNNTNSDLYNNKPVSAYENSRQTMPVTSKTETSVADEYMKSGKFCPSHLESRFPDFHSLVHSDRPASETLLSNKQDHHKFSASLGSVRAEMTDTSSDLLDHGTEEDMASLDLDSQTASLSYGSIRQLEESSEDLLSQPNMVQSVSINGVDCMVIPKEAYFQMRTDLSTLKQQLLFLSSLMQEDTDGLEQK